MAHKLPPEDFRSSRVVLDPDDFAVGNLEADPPPSDMVDQDTWDHLTTLPTDVSIRTSNEHGRHLRAQNDLMTAFSKPVIAILDEPAEPILWAMRDVNDELYAATFDFLHGFYRQSVSSLRSCLELMLDGSARATRGLTGGGRSSERFSFQRSAGVIRSARRVQVIDDKLDAACGRRLFGRPGHAAGEGWIGDLYGRLSEYAHARPGRTLGDTWGSNGPIYVGAAVQDVHILFAETVCAACVLASVGRPALTFGAKIDLAFASTEVTPTKIASVALWEACGCRFV